MPRLSTRCLIALTALGMPAQAGAQVLVIEVGGARWVTGNEKHPVLDMGAEAASSVDSSPVDSDAVTSVSSTAGPAVWQATVQVLAAKYDISPSLLEALVWQESRWNPAAVSSAGARGLTQLMPGTARDLGVDPRNPSHNLEGGARYLRAQLDAFGGDLEKALAAYNAGPARVQKAGGIPRIAETQNYVAAILGRLSAPVRR